MKQISMYNIMQEHLRLLHDLEEAEGEITPEIESLMQLNQDSFEEKAASYGYVIKHFDDRQDVISNEIKRLQSLKDGAVKSSEYLRQKLSDAMKQFGFERIERNNLKLSFRPSKAVEIIDETILPAEYFTEPKPPAPDKKKIKEAIEHNEHVPGAEIITRMNLQIK